MQAIYVPHDNTLIIFISLVSFKLLALHTKNLLYFIVCNPVNISCPNYEVVGFQPQTVDVPHLGSVKYPSTFLIPQQQRCMQVTRQDEQMTITRYKWHKQQHTEIKNGWLGVLGIKLFRDSMPQCLGRG